ncbi:universal stress protein [Ruania alkalisoli]|uniref:Universal stress protein n=1 Tax=Ruania alkalisoli TaxID=2779775 RepID=A0A7M1T077_9MICO|nr:universal stress protein [Ruania alkalisoli]QOR72382.1 universal stress protein [Ruania alkalisoli]
MGERILVGLTDGSAARRASEWAVERAIRRGGSIELISIVGSASGALSEAPVLEHALELTEELLAQQAERIGAGGVPVTTRLERGGFVDCLVDASKSVDLLVIGSDYRGPGAQSPRGPYGIRVAGGAHCPVVVVPDIEIAGRTGVVVGVDGSEHSANALRFAAAEAHASGDPLTAVSTWTTVPLPLHVRSYPTEYLAGMQEATEELLTESLAPVLVDYPDLEVRRLVQRESAGQAINRLAQEARLTVVGSHGRGRVARFLLGSTSEEVLAGMGTVTVVVR